MKLIEINWHPTHTQLRHFGLIAAFLLPVAAMVWHATTLVTLILAGLGVILAALGWLAPAVLRPVFIGISVVTLPIGLVLGEVALVILFYGVFTPLALLFRLLGRDALKLRRPKVDSYFREKSQPENSASYFRQW